MGVFRPLCLAGHRRAWPSSFQTVTLFLSDLVQYFQGQGPPPKFQAALHFWEESPDSSQTQGNVITVQVSSSLRGRGCRAVAVPAGLAH